MSWNIAWRCSRIESGTHTRAERWGVSGFNSVQSGADMAARSLRSDSETGRLVDAGVTAICNLSGIDPSHAGAVCAVSSA